jgi:predicted lipoprotein
MKPLLAIVVPIVVLAILRPWTVRPIEEAKPAVFDAASFAAAAWPKLLEEAARTAVDITAATSTETPPQARFVKATGIVKGVDRQSRVGVMRVHLPGDNAPALAIQIGPVIRGTALRDATSFIRFSDFTNQFDYAGAANALNDYALRTVIGPLSFDAMLGRTVTVTGAMGRSARRDDGSIEIVPVRFDVAEAVRK